MAGPYHHPPLPPYLGSWALASLAFTSPIVLALLLTIIRLVLSINSANSSIANAKQNLAASCTSLERTASIAVSFPHYMAANFNNATADGAEAMIHGLGTVLDLSLVGIEQIIIFIVDTYRSMYLCLADLVVRGSLTLATAASEEFSAFLTTTFQSIRGQVQDAVGAVDSVLHAAVETVNRIPGVNIQAPQINSPSLDFLNNVTLPSNFLNGLSALNNSLPTLDELKDRMNGIISIPFEDLRSDIRGNLGNATVDRSLMPIPAKETLSFCADLDLSFVDKVGQSLVKVAKYGILALALSIVLFIGVMVLKERLAFRSLTDFVESSRMVWLNDMSTANGISRPDAENALSTPTMLGFLQTSSNPLLRWLSNALNRIPRMKRSARARSNTMWFFAYITYLPALLLLLVALLGLLTIEIQLAALKPTEASAQAQVDAGLSGFKDQIRAKINNATQASSLAYSSASNAVLSDLENSVNNGMFAWTNTTTVTLNTTINEFYNGLTDAINNTFGGTILAAPALDVVQCLIGTKIAGLSTALTWLHDNGHVTLPKVDPNIFMLSQSASDELVNSLDDPSAPSGSKSSSIVRTLIDEYRSMLEKERIGFLILLGLYLLVVIFGLAAVLWNELFTPRLRTRRSTQGLKALQLGTEQEVDSEKHPLAFVRSGGLRKGSASAGTTLPAFFQRLQALPSSLFHAKRRKAREESFATPDAFLVSAYPAESQTEKGENKIYSSRPQVYDPETTSSRVNLLDALREHEPRTTASPGQSHTASYNASLPLPPVPIVPYYNRPTRTSSYPAARTQRHASNPFATPFDAPSER